jgi:hypothetical protein
MGLQSELSLSCDGLPLLNATLTERLPPPDRTGAAQASLRDQV